MGRPVKANLINHARNHSMIIKLLNKKNVKTRI